MKITLHYLFSEKSLHLGVYIGNPKKPPNKVLHRNAFTDYHPYIFGHSTFQQYLVELAMWGDRM